MDRSISENPHVDVDIDDEVNIVSQFSSVYAPSVREQAKSMQCTLDFDDEEVSVVLADEEGADGHNSKGRKMLANCSAPVPIIRKMKEALLDGVNENRSQYMQGKRGPEINDFAGLEDYEGVHASMEIGESQPVFTASDNTPLVHRDTRNTETSVDDAADVVECDVTITDNTVPEETINPNLALMNVEENAEDSSLDT